MSTGNVNPISSGLPITDPLNPISASPFTATNAFAGEFLGLPIPDEDQLWGLSPVSPTMGTGNWDAKADAAAFAGSALERDLKNAQVRNGQPTPPPYEDHLTRESAGLDLDNAHKRRRAREYQTAAESLSPDLDDASPHQERAKRAKFLERNRVAASKCRQKKKEHTQQLESRYKQQSEKKEQLVCEIAKLRSEILSLKNEVLKHAQCGDEPIKLHLAQMVKKITDTDGPPPATTTTTAVAMDSHIDVMETAPSPDVVPTPTPVTAAMNTSTLPPQLPPQSTALSFGFDDSLQLEPAAAAAAADVFEQQLRRDSETSLVTESSYAFSADDTFDDLINV
ncbi:Basic leucine zipper (bZIP) transcription factor atfB [Penicillium malachiteum]|uniref:Basic leucine zipper (bZIP) transcription factor atfB n=1 Tax=Penicillium malachiteum TaxID=1324776 RepID=UPI002546EB6A|nr:Basic leucine zipper (bZIP) transcription factor atfB [Penicillium malachiteum]KAJ5713191.1 Basic leucine zipper (bZIP) transcription factor atfB [Penicillium malachiteum]